MRILVIGPAEKETLEALKKNAEAHPLSFDDLLDVYNKREPSIGDRPGFSCIIPDGFRTVFSIECQPKKDGSGFLKTRHVSISVPDPDKVPSVESCEMITRELGFTEPRENQYVHIEEWPGGKAVNIIEIVK
jgi:hypothetical protein